MKIIGIDIGTTTISAVVADGLRVVQKYTVANGCDLRTECDWGRAQDTEKIVAKAKAVLDEILDLDNDIHAIGLTGQMHGILYADKNGKAVSPLYTWQDGSGNQREFGGKSVCEILAEDGFSAATGYGMVTYLYHSKKGLVPKTAASLCTIADYFGMALTGRVAPLVHISQAAGMGLYNCKKRVFMSETLAKHGANPALAPTITAEMEPLGTYRGIPVFASLGDNQASFLGSVRDTSNTILVNVGTGSQISVLSDRCDVGNGIEARPLTKDCYLLVGSALCGGAAFAALEQFFREYAVAAGASDVSQYDIMKSLLEHHKGQNEAWQVKTTFAGTRENPAQTGSIFGITTANFHPATLIRGVLNGMVDELYNMYQVMQKQAEISCLRLVASGNGIRKNPLLQQILGERFGMPMEVEQNEEEAAFGAAISAQNYYIGTGLKAL